MSALVWHRANGLANNDALSESSQDSGSFTPQSTTVQRQLLITKSSITCPINIPQSIWEPATHLRDRFIAEPDTEDNENYSTITTTAELLARFQRFLANHIQTGIDDSQDASSELLSSTIDYFEVDVLGGCEVHTGVAALEIDADAKLGILRDYINALQVLGRPYTHDSSALFDAVAQGSASVYAIFGGQGNDDRYFEGLREVYNTYRPLVEDLITSAAPILQHSAKESRYSDTYDQGLNLLQWLQDPSTQPDDGYLVSAPVSFPLIGVLQLAHYQVVGRLLGRSPKEMHKALSGTTGHSQGIVVSVVIAAANDWTAFKTLSLQAIRILQSIGVRSQQHFSITSLPPSIVADAEENGEGQPTPMLSVRDLTRQALESVVKDVNQHLHPAAQIHISIVNGLQNFILTGQPMSLHGLNVRLRAIKAPTGSNQARMPASKRKPNITHRFLPVTAPFHSPYLCEVADAVDRDLERIVIRGSDLRIPTYATNDGRDLGVDGQKNIVPALVRMITEQVQDWTVATRFAKATHVLDFGPGGVSGVGSLINYNQRGSGIRVIVASLLDGTNRNIGYKPELLDWETKSVVAGQEWISNFSPKLIKSAAGMFVNTRMTRVLGLPPVMVAGMTPTTVSWEFVAAVMNAGYHVELALGGYLNAESVTTAIKNIAAEVGPGRGITCNVIYAAPTAVKWQLPLIKQLISEGQPIDGLTFGAGVPSLDVATEYIRDLGLKHIGFKPGSFDAISKVIEIAQANPSFPIFLQWTGGRGGGHHSFEDFHKPLVQTYGTIRSCDNIVLVAGSGFGGASDSYAYLTGQWSEEMALPTMPFDGVLLGSRVMAAKEAKTSLAVKQAIVDTPGLDDSEWEKTYQGPAGGIITVMSEMGEPIHKIATRGVIFWAEMDKTIFSLDKSKRVAALHKRKDYIIKKLNDDCQKVWFGRDMKTDKATDLENMTYADVIQRLVQLTYVAHERRWIDKSYRKLVLDFVSRAEARIVRDAAYTSAIQSTDELQDPEYALAALFKALPALDKRPMSFQDVQYFLSLCRRRGQKPVPFVPALDENFEIYFKKDSLWQSEDLEAVVDGDVGRVCILQGPVAAKHSKIVNEPVKEILDKIHLGHSASLLGKLYNGVESAVPTVECLNFETKAALTELPEGIVLSSQDFDEVYEVVTNGDVPLPDTDDWLDVLAGQKGDWRQALFKTRKIIRDRKVLDNPIRTLFEPRSSAFVGISRSDSSGTQVISMYERNGEDSPTQVIKVRLTSDKIITVSLIDSRNVEQTPLSLEMKFSYHPECSYAPLHEITSGRIERVYDFYHRLWFGDKLPRSITPTDGFVSPSGVISKDNIIDFAQSVGNNNGAYTRSLGKRLMAPMDFAVVVAWRPLIMPLFAADAPNDLLSLVHLSNEFRMTPNAKPIYEGDILEARTEVTAVVNEPAGRLVEVSGCILRANVSIMKLKSQFLIRGKDFNMRNTFRVVDHPPVEVFLESEKDVEVLKAKKWFHVDAAAPSLLGKKVRFQLQTTLRYKDEDNINEAITTGAVLVQSFVLDRITVGEVKHVSEASTGNAVLAYLDRHGVPLTSRVMFKDPLTILNEGDTTIRFPVTNEQYAKVSGDYNPIHVSKTLADYVGLPGTITHGMHTSASVRSIAERWLCPTDINLFRSWKCSFVGMVLPGDEVSVSLQHIGMVDGRKIVSVTAINHETKSVVLTGEAEVEQPSTALVFTGQGSQEKNMGMDLYETSAAARDVWDRADKHFSDTYGFKITDIVRKNPTRLDIHFRGKRGRQIRQNYMDLCVDTVAQDDTVHSVRVFPDISETSTVHTFKHLGGLLSATQFTQPALTLMEKAIFEDMRARGLVSPHSSYAGHSLGEYSALCSVAEIMPLEALMSVVFYRGLTMQNAVARDAQGRSAFAMCAVNPSRLAKPFDESTLKFIVNAIATETNSLLEVVNYNVTGTQYVCAGHIFALNTLAAVLDHIHATKSDLQHLITTESLSVAQASILSTIWQCLDTSPALATAELKRSVSTIPLNGIDVPFHSSYLKSGVEAFRECLYKHMDRRNLDPALLIGRYVPNLTARPFELTKEYFREVFELTGSPLLGDIVDEWDNQKSARARNEKNPNAARRRLRREEIVV